MDYTCPNGQTIAMNTSGTTDSGTVQSLYPNLLAQKINLTMYDVMQTIQEGRAAGNIVPFNISGATMPGI